MTESANPVLDNSVTIDRRSDHSSEERRGNDRRSEPRAGESEGRRKQQRRRQIDPTTCERDYNDQEIEFMHAMDQYKRAAGRMFPTCSEVLEVVRSLGYVQLNDEQRDTLKLADTDIVECYNGEARDDEAHDDEDDEL